MLHILIHLNQIIKNLRKNNMAKLINLTRFRGRKHITYGHVYPINEDITLIGSNANCDITLDGFEHTSRQHAFVILEGNGFYVGDMSTRGTWIHIKKPFFGYHERIQLFNALEASCERGEMDKDEDFRFERAFSIVNGEYDLAEARRNFFLDKYLKKEDAVERLLEAARLFKLNNKDIIEIYPNFLLKSK